MGETLFWVVIAAIWGCIAGCVWTAWVFRRAILKADQAVREADAFITDLLERDEVRRPAWWPPAWNPRDRDDA